MNSINPANPTINLKEITAQTIPAHEEEPFFAFVPTYLDGGDGFTSGYTEMMTNPLGEYIAEGKNADNLIGVVGSGNKNFNEQYCLTARMCSPTCLAGRMTKLGLPPWRRSLPVLRH